MTDDPTRLQTKDATLVPADNGETKLHPSFSAQDDRTRIDPTKQRAPIKSAHRTLSTGDIIKERFILDKLLGQGGMGAVYRALDLRKKEAGDNKPYVALKLLSDDFKNHPEALVTLQREARKTQELAHPNIVTVYDFDRDGDLIYLTMEELKGASLADLISDKSIKFSLKQKLDFLNQMCEGLAYAHSKGIVHCDLKPGNIFITDNDQLKLLDFGIARAANTDAYDDTFDAGKLGALTVGYASLEMLNYEPPHPSDDIYALGIIACELIGGSHPYGKQSAQRASELGTQPQIPPIKNPFLKQLLLKSIALKRKDRIQNADVFRKKLAIARNGIKTISIAIMAILLIAAGNFYYLSHIANNEIDFNDLPEAAKTEFNEHLKEAKTALSFEDLQGAVININQAFGIHQSQKDMVKMRDNIVSMLTEKLASAPDEKTKLFYQEQLQQLKNYPAFANAINTEKP